MSQPADPSTSRRIGKQVVLPWSKAVEIAIKSIKVRFWRSMITMSSIVLAIAFLMSIWTSTAITASLAVGPQADIDAIRGKIAGVQKAIDAGATIDPLTQTYSDELDDALDWNAEQIEEKEEARDKKSATAKEKETLKGEIEALQAKATPENQPALLLEYLKAERRNLERMKGGVDGILQQERTGGEETAEGAQEGDEPRETAKATAGGGPMDFISQMSPTDSWLAILALLVCLVGIANAMFMTVQERFREIGTMKCLGALDGFIVKLFLIESSGLGFIGTVVGVVVGLLLSSIRQLIVYGGPVARYYPIGNMLVAGVLATIIGLVLSIGAAIFPARRAARMEPVEAMRVEE